MKPDLLIITLRLILDDHVFTENVEINRHHEALRRILTLISDSSLFFSPFHFTPKETSSC